MKIALLGYGKMGKTIEKIAIKRGHQVVLKANKHPETADIANADVAIDFSVPEAAFENIKRALSVGVPVVSGTTGWLDRYEEIVSFCNDKNGTFLYASNFSVGVNLFFKLNEFLAKMMDKVSGYDVAIEEIHHIHKLDAPSGTAISLAEQLITHSSYENWKLGGSGDKTVPIIAIREGEVPGTHTVTYKSEIDQISIKHEAFGRDGFALGAVIAAEWIKDKKGVFNMNDVLEI